MALARSLAPSPRVLLLDEPFGALDLVLRSRLVEDVQRLVRELGITAISVSHDRNEAFTWCDRVAVMDGGRLVQIGAPAELMRRPGTELVAGLMGMRMVPGAVFGEPGAPGRCARGWCTPIVRPMPQPATAGTAGCIAARATWSARVPVGDRVRLVVRPQGWPDDVVVDAETDWDGAPAVGDGVVLVVPRRR